MTFRLSFFSGCFSSLGLLFAASTAHAQYTPACNAQAPQVFTQDQVEVLCAEARNALPATCANVILSQRESSAIQLNNDEIVEYCRKQQGLTLIDADQTPGDIAAEFTEKMVESEKDLTPLSELRAIKHYEVNLVAGVLATGWLSQAASFQSKLTNMYVAGVEVGRAFYTRKYLEMSVMGGIYDFTSANHGSDQMNLNLSYALCFRLPQAAHFRFCASEGLSYFPGKVPYLEQLNAASNGPPQGTARLLNYLTFRWGIDVTPTWAIGVGINHRSGAGAFWAGSPFKSDQGNGINMPLNENPRTAVGDASNQYVFYSTFYLRDLAFWKLR